MTAEQKRYYDDMVDRFDKDLMDNPAFEGLVRQMSYVLAEEDQLQEFVNQNGAAYEHTNRDGGTMWKRYPQYAALKDVRTHKIALMRLLLKYTNGETDVDEDEHLIA